MSIEELFCEIDRKNLKLRFKNPKYYENALRYLKTDSAEEIIKFVNGSNSKAGKAYYICRNLPLSELDDYKKNFIKASYSKKSRKMVSKQTRKRTGNSYGYCGWTDELPNGRKYYCRSTREFVFVYWFISKYPEFRLEGESKIFKIGDFSYKPDFFIYDKSNKLIKIVEVKSNGDSFIQSKKMKQIKSFFYSINIEYEVVSNTHELEKEVDDLHTKVKEWKNTRQIPKNLSGSKNPRYCGKTDSEIEQILRREFEKIDDVLTSGHYLEIAEKFNLPKNLGRGSKNGFRKIDIFAIMEEINIKKGHPIFKNRQEKREYRRKLKKKRN